MPPFKTIQTLDIGQLEENTLLVFLDETGDEELKDNNHPIFGYGGCAVMLEDYNRLVYEPWRDLKQKCFGNSDHLLHATKIRRPSLLYRREAKTFFQTKAFSRFAAITKRSTSIDPTFTKYVATHYGAIVAIRNIAQWYFQNTSITLIMESSARLDPMVEKYFGDITFAIDGVEIPLHKYFLSKDAGEPGLEVADHIVRTSGRNAVRRIKGLSVDPDYMFTDVDKKLQYYISLDSVDFTPSE